LEPRQRRGAGAMKALKNWLPSSRTTAIATPFVFLLLFFMSPFFVVMQISVADTRLGIPPYTNLAEWVGGVLTLKVNLVNYLTVFADDLYFDAYLESLKMAAITTLVCLLVGYPAAYLIAKSNSKTRHVLLMAVMLPFWTFYLIRVYAWMGILKDQGLFNHFLLWLHVIDQPLHLFRTNVAVYIGMTYSYLPYLILPVYASLVRMDRSLLEAAYDLGAKPWKAFVTITIPMSLRGIVAGCLLVFIPSVGEYVIPELLGGANTLTIGRLMWEDFFGNMDWPVASAATVIMVVLLLLPLVLFGRLQTLNEARD
jgi:putrescine transport system permease protein